jgi:DNA-damage-inducible protein J
MLTIAVPSRLPTEAQPADHSPEAKAGGVGGASPPSLHCIDNVTTINYTVLMTTIQIRTQEKTKKCVQKILAELGLDMSTAINMYLVQITKQGGIPFDILTENGMTLKAEREILAAAEDVRNSKETYSSAEEMFDAILK